MKALLKKFSNLEWKSLFQCLLSGLFLLSWTGISINQQRIKPQNFPSQLGVLITACDCLFAWPCFASLAAEQPGCRNLCSRWIAGPGCLGVGEFRCQGTRKTGLACHKLTPERLTTHPLPFLSLEMVLSQSSHDFLLRWTLPKRNGFVYICIRFKYYNLSEWLSSCLPGAAPSWVDVHCRSLWNGKAKSSKWQKLVNFML